MPEKNFQEIFWYNCESSGSSGEVTIIFQPSINYAGNATNGCIVGSVYIDGVLINTKTNE